MPEKSKQQGLKTSYQLVIFQYSSGGNGHPVVTVGLKTSQTEEKPNLFAELGESIQEAILNVLVKATGISARLADLSWRDTKAIVKIYFKDGVIITTEAEDKDILRALALAMLAAFNKFLE